MTDKNEAFHRLASKRLENITDAIRIFGNLSGPSYEWTPGEVKGYVGKIEEAVAETLGRFTETKRWRTAPPDVDIADPELNHDEANGGEAKASDERDLPELVDDRPVAPPKPAAHDNSRRSMISRIMAEAADDREALAEMVHLQRMVIQDMQRKLDDSRAERGPQTIAA